MKNANSSRSWPSTHARRRQRGQALIFGIFVLAAGLASLLYVFNAGQLIHDKGKLVNAADAAAYSGGLMQARALNYAAYTNRALLANEMTVAQTVGLTSWLRFQSRHAQMANLFGCRTPWNLPVSDTFLRYAPLCMALAWSEPAITSISNQVNVVAPGVIAGVEASKVLLQAAQANMMIRMVAGGRHRVMQEVASANFAGDGQVDVDTIPLQDGFFLFEGAPVLRVVPNNQRNRFAAVAVQSASQDRFNNNRNWRDRSLLPSCVGINGFRFNRVERAGGTNLIGFDEWKAVDSASRYSFRMRKGRCVENSEQVIAGGQSAAFRTNDAEFNDTNAFGRSRAINPRASRSAFSTREWQAYRGLPNFMSLSNAALSYTPEQADVNRRNLTLRLSIRVTRRPSEIRNAEGRSLVRSTGQRAYGINDYRGAPMRGQYAAVATSEVFFDRPTARADGRTELPNEFNPFWQVRLVRSDAAIAAATALQMN
ncbi:hypothetical protein EYS42_07080 [Aquabacterium lacunae]|uniref:Putative Flp pilus-assembly TadG-like N-terminal domain-containing protein n=1 Tax=Aquabacterium lacunae TaxID=2528630 RepID=A0A4Q9H0U2_9BURK|nr:Tad domain-containing protein [Aquabacterium lacunae]TBO32919.1 hypothetical protein EYS42_07080 [Aquabacterium lacunae]